MTDNPRPISLTVLCYLSLLISGAAVVLGIFGWAMPQDAGNFIEQIGQLNIGLYLLDIPVLLFYIPFLLFNLTMVFGALKMLKMKRSGLIIYTVGNVLLAIMMVLFLMKVDESPWIITGIILGYLVLYLLHYRSFKTA